MGPLVATSRRDAALHHSCEGLANKRHAPGESSATETRCIVDHRAAVAAGPTRFRQTHHWRSGEILRLAPASLLELSLHAHVRSIAERNGAGWRIARRGDIRERPVSNLGLGRYRRLAGIREVVSPFVQPTARDRCNATLR